MSQSPAKNSLAPSTIGSPKVSPIFESHSEKQNAIKLHMQGLSRMDTWTVPSLFAHGLRFRPGLEGTNVYRTLLITNLPADLTLAKLLDEVRGGVIFDAQLLNTTSITGSHSAIITFLNQDAAIAYKGYVTKYAIVFHGLLTKVSMLTPTWPIKPQHYKQILDHKQTRCLEIHEFPHSVEADELTAVLRTCPVQSNTWLVRADLTKDSIFNLQFSSIEHASRAYDNLSKFKRFAKCSIKFASDPCAQPLQVAESLHEDCDATTTTKEHPAEALRKFFF